ncbi:hypothetical protein CPB83DRAFT_909813 [Crepidotus variabilis]|uniref:Uncharacterized protein n=1 Tax=Crepidotus variabilis TaxID=179855 RepID=A0A9P6JL80_9AGAR|nr:hypothetical protein CPB83DRAFT_909813 [Crepidotus variabilis]
MIAEAFPNSEQLFQQALVSRDPVPDLLHLLKTHPTPSAVNDLIIAYTDLIDAEPHRGPSLATALVRLSHSIDAPKLGDSTLRDAIHDDLEDRHFRSSSGLDNTIFGPKNQYLIDSLLSGLSLRDGWASSKEQYAAFQAGLNSPSNKEVSKGSESSEVLVMGTCIQLLLCGYAFVTEMAGSYQMKKEVVASKLRMHKEGGTVKDPRAIPVLELALLHAESGLKPENNRDDVWALLFPVELK